MQENGLYKKKKKKTSNKNYPVGEKQDSWQGLAGQGRVGHDTTRQDKTRQDKTRQDKTRQDKTRQEWETFDDELAQDCKHKEIIKGANEEGNEGRQVGQINQ